MGAPCPHAWDMGKRCRILIPECGCPTFGTASSSLRWDIYRLFIVLNSQPATNAGTHSGRGSHRRCASRIGELQTPAHIPAPSRYNSWESSPGIFLSCTEIPVHSPKEPAMASHKEESTPDANSVFAAPDRREFVKLAMGSAFGASAFCPPLARPRPPCTKTSRDSSSPARARRSPQTMSCSSSIRSASSTSASVRLPICAPPKAFFKSRSATPTPASPCGTSATPACTTCQR